MCLWDTALLTFIRHWRWSAMFREPKSLREIHKIQEQIYREEKGLTDKQVIEKTRCEVAAIKKKYGLNFKQKVTV